MGLFKFEGRIYQKISNSYIISKWRFNFKNLGKVIQQILGFGGTRSLFKKRKNWFPNMFWPLWPDILHSLLLLSWHWRKCQNMVKIVEVLYIPLHLELHLEVMVSITLNICLEWKKLTRTSLVGYDVNRNI